MKIAYYPGCSAKGSSLDYELSTQAVLKALGQSEPADGFAAMEALEKYTGIRAPEPLRTLKAMPVRHRDVTEKDGMLGYIQNLI